MEDREQLAEDELQPKLCVCIFPELNSVQGCQFTQIPATVLPSGAMATLENWQTHPFPGWGRQEDDGFYDFLPHFHQLKVHRTPLNREGKKTNTDKVLPIPKECSFFHRRTLESIFRVAESS